jgi:site-specific recombinase XerD
VGSVSVDVVVDDGSVEGLLLEYGMWLDRQRGLASVTVRNYRKMVRSFLGVLVSPAEDAVRELDARTVTAFMVEYCRDRNISTAKSMARSVRSFLRFAHATGRTRVGLWGAVPASTGWHLAGLPCVVPASDIERLLAVAACARSTAAGRRDYAILSLLARFGLRRGEVVRLRLEDIDWRAGEITVVGKGDRVERLPLLAEPGEAIAAWLVDGRPRCDARTVFATVRTPFRPMSPGAIGHVVATACQRAGLPRIGAHRLRHTLATEMLRAGASLPEVGQVLRHRSDRSTAIYAKVDEKALWPLARRWPAAGVGQELRPLARRWPGAQS